LTAKEFQILELLLRHRGEHPQDFLRAPRPFHLLREFREPLEEFEHLLRDAFLDLEPHCTAEAPARQLAFQRL